MSYTTPTLSLVGQASNVILNVKTVHTSEKILDRGYQSSWAYSSSSLGGEW